MVRNGQHIVQQPVDPLAYLKLRFVRFDVHVTGARSGRVAENEIDEPHDGRQLDVLGERGWVDQVVLGLA